MVVRTRNQCGSTPHCYPGTNPHCVMWTQGWTQPYSYFMSVVLPTTHPKTISAEPTGVSLSLPASLTSDNSREATNPSPPSKYQVQFKVCANYISNVFKNITHVNNQISGTHDIRSQLIHNTIQPNTHYQLKYLVINIKVGINIAYFKRDGCRASISRTSPWLVQPLLGNYPWSQLVICTNFLIEL